MLDVRQLVNVAYAYLADGRDEQQLRDLDLILDGADVAAAGARIRAAGAATQGQPPAMSARERLLRSMPTQNPLALVANMQGVAARTGGR